MSEAAHIVVKDKTSPGTFSPTQFYNLIWANWYQTAFQYNRSPWVTEGLAVACADLRPIEPYHRVPVGAWLIELLDESTEAGALGWHEDKVRQSSAHALRGLAAGTETPLAKVFVHTSKQAGVPPSEVLSHELLEMLVDPYVMDESKIRKYLNTADDNYYIGEVGDPVQDEGYDVGVPEGRPCKVKEAIVANFALPGWWGIGKGTRLDFRGTRKAAFELAPGGYMSIAPEAEPESWSQIYGSDRPRAEANAHAYEGREERAERSLEAHKS